MPGSDVKLTIVNRALVNAGEMPVVTLDDDDDALRAILKSYDEIVEEELETGVWKFAMTTAEATHQNDEAEEPLTEQWTLPEECLRVVSVLYDGAPLNGDFYEINGRTIRTIYDSLITVTYIRMAEEEDWPARFRGIIATRCQAVAMRTHEDHSGAAGVEEIAEMKTVKAKHAEASQRSNRPTNDGSIVQRRRLHMGRR